MEPSQKGERQTTRGGRGGDRRKIKREAGGTGAEGATELEERGQGKRGQGRRGQKAGGNGQKPGKEGALSWRQGEKRQGRMGH